MKLAIELNYYETSAYLFCYLPFQSKIMKHAFSPVNFSLSQASMKLKGRAEK